MGARDVAATIEDLETLDEARVGANEAAERVGFPNAEAMEKWLERHDANDLWLAFKKRDPIGYHTTEQRSQRRATDDGTAALLAQAEASTRARTRNKAAKARALIEELRSTVRAEAEDDRIAAEARKEIETLERQLAKAKARLRGGAQTVTVGSSVSAADLREWARRKGVDCPAMGRIPAVVREAFEADEEAVS